jgi:hypothetical protein
MWPAEAITHPRARSGQKYKTIYNSFPYICRELPRPSSESNTSEVLELAHFTAEDTKPVFMVTYMVLNYWQQLTTASCSFECCCHPYTVKHWRILVPQFCNNKPDITVYLMRQTGETQTPCLFSLRIFIFKGNSWKCSSKYTSYKVKCYVHKVAIITWC